MYLIYSIATLLIFCSSVTLGKKSVAQWHVDFDVSMGKGTPEYEKKFADPAKRKALDDARALYEKNNLSRVKYHQAVKIPRIIHQIWVGNKKLPKNYSALKDTWLKHHPGWRYILWTPKKIKRLTLYNKKFYDRASEPEEKANILRYELLDQFGGLYCDVDFECLKSFDLLHHCYDFYTGLTPLDSAVMFNNALIGCAPGHPLIKQCIRTMKDHMHKSNRFSRNGVGFFSSIFTSLAHVVPGITIAFPATYFYPLKLVYNARERIDCLKPESFAVHYWASRHGQNVPRLKRKPAR